MTNLLALVKFDGTNSDADQVLVQSGGSCLPNLPDGIEDMTPDTGDSCAVIKSKLQLCFELVFLRTVHSGNVGTGAMHIAEALCTSGASKPPAGLSWILAKDADAEAVEQYVDNFKSFGFR